MTESFLLILFKVIWNDIIEDVYYDSTKRNWQTLQVAIDEIKSNKQASKDLAAALERCFYSSDKIIAEECRDELIKNSTYTQYRGAKIYKPIENDTAIRSLDKKIKLWDKEFKQVGKKLFVKKPILNPSDLEEFLKQLSQSDYESSEAAKKNAKIQLLEEVEKDCDASIYKAAIRDKKHGLTKRLLHSFFIDIEPNEELNRIFNAKTYIILNKMRDKF